MSDSIRKQRMNDLGLTACFVLYSLLRFCRAGVVVALGPGSDEYLKKGDRVGIKFIAVSCAPLHVATEPRLKFSFGGLSGYLPSMRKL